MNRPAFRRRHLATLGGGPLALLAGFEPPADPAAHAVVSLDWWFALAPAGAAATGQRGQHDRLIAARNAAEQAAFTALVDSPRRLRAFRRLLADAQHVVPIREEQARELTLAWPVMRRAVHRIGEELVVRGVIAAPDDVFFLTHTEVLTALGGAGAAGIDIAARRQAREEQAHLVPPLSVGRTNPMLQKVWDSYPGLLGAVPSDRALVSGVPASAGRASGLVRVVRGPEQFDQLQPGDVLVAPLTAPAWTPLFTKAIAVVTDVG